MTSKPFASRPFESTFAAAAPRVREITTHRPALRKILLASGVLSSVWYVATDLIGTLRYPGYSFANQEFSELLAAGAPTRSLMVALNGIPYGVLVTAFAAGVWASTGGRRAGRATGVMLIGYAVAGMVTGVFFPMDQREVIATGEASMRNSVHGPGTAVMSLFLLIAMGFGAMLLGRRFRYYTYGTIIALVAFGILASTQIGQLEANAPTPWMGIHERVNIYATMLWIAVLAIGLWRARGVGAQPGLMRPAAMPRELR
jgi:hypothetical protein